MRGHRGYCPEFPLEMCDRGRSVHPGLEPKLLESAAPRRPSSFAIDHLDGTKVWSDPRKRIEQCWCEALWIGVGSPGVVRHQAFAPGNCSAPTTDCLP